ncbi:ufd1, partial [Symbiodinium sp. KB8]
MAARLYPGFGSGRGKFEGSFEVRSLKAGGFPQLEAGDKVILPAAAFKEISRLKLPFPMIFRVENERRRSAGRVANRRGATKAPVKQFCGVQEFSAEKGKAFLPRWMMQNLKIRDGGRAVFTSVRGMPKGTFVRFQPHTTEFIDLAAALGPRELMEHAMKTYSALSLGETLVVQCSGSMFKLDVLEVRPGPKDDPPNPHSAICLYGDLDLEADFAPAKDTEKASTPAAGSITPMSQGELDDLAGQALAAAQAAATPAEEAPGSAAFSGTGHTLGGGGNRRGDRGTAGSGAGAGPRPSSAKRLRSAVAASRHRATARPMSPIESSPMPTPTTDAKRRPRRAAGTSATTPSSSRTPRRQAGKRQGTGGKGSAGGKGGRTHAAEPAPASPGFRASRATAAPPVAPQASFGLGFFSGTWRGLDLGTPPRGMSRAQRE